MISPCPWVISTPSTSFKVPGHVNLCKFAPDKKTYIMEQNPESVQRVMDALKQDVRDYHNVLKDAPHDPLKMLVAGMVNKQILDEAAEECQKAAEKTGLTPPTAEKLKEIQEWAFKYKKKHPLAKMEQVQRATALAFNLVIVADEPA